MCGFCMQNSDFWPRIANSMGPRYHVSFCACNPAWLAPELLVSMGPSPFLWHLHAKQRLLEQNYKSVWDQDHTCGFCMQNSAFWTRVTSLYGSQTWPVVLCMYNSGLNIRITSLYGSQPSSVVFECKTAWLASGLLVSMGPSPHLWLLHAKQRLLDLNYKSLWVQDITCGFVHANSAFSTWITSLYCSQPLSAVFGCKTATFGAELQVWMGPRPHLSFCACKTAWLAPELQVSMGPRPHQWFWAHITACLAQD